jgi:hypothetical protein
VCREHVKFRALLQREAMLPACTGCAPPANRGEPAHRRTTRRRMHHGLPLRSSVYRHRLKKPLHRPQPSKHTGVQLSGMDRCASAVSIREMLRICFDLNHCHGQLG